MTPKHIANRAIHRVLVIFPGALGDLMCAMPALAAISRRHPRASIELMARHELARLAAGRTVVARGHSIDAREMSALFGDASSDSARQFFAGFDLIYSFFASDDPRFRARLSAATDADVSFHPFRPGGDGHVAEGYLQSIDAGALQEGIRLEPTADDLAAAERALERANCCGSNLAVIFPGSGSRAKNWPADKFAALATMLASESGILRAAATRENDKRQGLPSNQASVAAILGPAEASIEPVFRDAGVPVLKDLELPTVAAIARLASAFVGNDSGVSHLAAAVGAPGVVIFGPTDPVRWRPLGRRIDILARNPIDSIEVDEVAGTLSKFVAQPQR